MPLPEPSAFFISHTEKRMPHLLIACTNDLQDVSPCPASQQIPLGAVTTWLFSQLFQLHGLRFNIIKFIWFAQVVPTVQRTEKSTKRVSNIAVEECSVCSILLNQPVIFVNFTPEAGIIWSCTFHAQNQQQKLLKSSLNQS